MNGHPTIAFGGSEGAHQHLRGHLPDGAFDVVTVFWLGRYDGPADCGYAYTIGSAHEGDASFWRHVRALHPDLRGARLGHATAVSPDGTTAAFTSHRLTDPVWLFDVASGQIVGDLPGRYYGLAFHPDGRRLAAAGIDGTIDVWDYRRRERLASYTGHQSTVYCVDYSPDGSRLASGGNDTTVRIWDADSGDQLLELRGHEQYVHAILFSPDGSQLASASGDTTVRIWDTVPRAERRRR